MIIYPSILDYINALEQPSISFLDKKLARTELVRDANSEPIYSLYRGYVIFAAKSAKKNYEIRLFLDQNARDNYVLVEGSEIFVDAMSLYNGREMVTVDVVLCEVDREFDFIEERVAQFQESEDCAREDRVAFESCGKWGFKNSVGNVVVEAIYDSVELFYEGRAVVEVEGYFGVIDRSGNRVVEVVYDEISYDNSYWFYVEKEGLYGVLDRNGLTTLECEWDWIAEQSCELFLVERCGKYRFVDTLGCDVMGMEYDQATSFSSLGTAMVTNSGLSYYINTKGVRVSPQSRIPIAGR